MLKRTSASVLAGLGALLMASAIASSSRAAGGDEGDRAEQLFKDGRDLYLANRCGEALPLLEESLRLKDAPIVVLHMATCEAALGRKLDAARRLPLLLDQFSGEPERFRRASRLLDELLIQLGRIEIRGERSAQVVVVEVDGNAWAPDHDGALLVEPGEHRITVRYRGLPPRHHIVWVAAKERLVWEVLPPLHRVLATSGPRAAPVRPADKPRPAAVWVSGAVGAVGVLTGAATGIAALVLHNELSERCPLPNKTCYSNDNRHEIERKKETGRMLDGATLVSGAIGLAGLAGFVGHYVYVRIDGAAPGARRASRVERVGFDVRVRF
ncbi:putative membrane protein [Sorangium cellulosum So ce56]|uniref:Membrane protein n=1 Tax=Sorangium cellulosum (strain So ce56) TaxID=448385 RepID=A9GVR4_SORC5|nr:hypothetical protein [Sorangium cellulosum]CAN93830.1 putative membrane protein [Sorangium cellulosum So ce56]